MREYQVRICEGLGVKFPGPTRRTSNVSTIEICLVRSACHSISSAQWPLRPKNRQSVRDANDPIENLLAVERKSS
jgi:hypothetical protein